MSTTAYFEERETTMKSEKTKYFTIFSQRLAGYLMLSGFRLAEMRKDEKGTMKNIFFFVDSEDLQNEIRKFKNNKIHK